MKKRSAMWVFVLLAALAGTAATSIRRSPAKPISVVFADMTSEFQWTLGELAGPGPALPADWSEHGFLVLEMRTSSTQRFSLWIHTAAGKRRIMFHPFGLNVWMRAAVPLRYFQGRDARGTDLASTNNRRTDTFYIGVWGPFGPLKDVRAIGVEMDYPIGRPRLEIRSAALAREDPGSAFLEKTPVVDEFGQWARADWPRKVRSREQWARELAEEEGTLDAAAAEFKVGRYGGDLAAQTKATGFFRVEMIEGRWWLVDPEGHLFLSTGANGVSGGRSGENAGLSLRRMAAWGMNTIGNWSSLRPAGEEDRRAYVTMFRPPRSEPSFLGMPDVYSEEFARAVEQAAERMCAPLKDDPWLLGYFLGNEPPWPRRESELVDMFLGGPDSATKAALVAYLAEGDTPARRADFIAGMFDRYLTMVGEAIRKADPNHLNLGIRFGGMPEERILRMGRSFDVFSLNVYEYEPARQLRRIFEVTGKPVLIGEFHFGVPADGLGAGLVQCADQTERAKGYRYYMEQAAALPCFVGAHWFQWSDQPVLGRMDGENYNIGFVDVTGRAYAELVAAARLTHKRLGAVHAGKEAPFAERPKASAHGTPASPWD
jgi:hypothetical protein